MIYIYRNVGSTGARELAEGITLAGTVARRTRGGRLRTLTPQDQVVCWGSHFAATPGTRTLNNVAPLSKYAEAKLLAEKGVSTVTVTDTPPRAGVNIVPNPRRAPFTPGTITVRNADLTPAQANAIIAELQGFVRGENNRRVAYEQQPAPAPVPAVTWLPRRNNHVGGNDLLTVAPGNPDFWSKKENIVEEYRLHIFLGKSVRAGKKVQSPTRPDGRTAPHTWIRSYDAGWTIQYDNFESTKALRKLAKDAVKALGLDFGAVDIGKRADGTFLVLEVNRAPGLENNTTTSYANKIIAWSRGELPLAQPVRRPR